MRAILKNQDLLQETPIVNIFYDDFWGTPLVHSGSHKSYRPLCVLSYRLNHLLGRLDPFGYHLGNVLLHVLVTGLFTYTARAVVLRRTMPACLAGVLFAVHPVHTEAVAGIVGRADVGACLFFLFSFLCYVSYCEQRDSHTNHSKLRTSDREVNKPVLWHRWIFLTLSVSFATMSMLTKEHGMTVLAVNAAYDVFIQNKTRLRDLLSLRIFLKDCHRLWEGILSQVVSVAILLAFRLHFMGNKPPHFAPSDNPAASDESLQTRLLTFLYLPVLNAWLLVCPYRLSFDWSMEAVPLIESLTDIRNLFSLVYYSSLAAFAWYCFQELEDLHHGHEVNNRLKAGSSDFSNCPSNCRASRASNGHGVAWTGSSDKRNGHARNGYTHIPSPSCNNSNGNGIRHDTLSSLRKRTSNGQRKNHHHPSSQLTGSSSPSIAPSSFQERTRILNVVIVSMVFMILPFVPATNLFFYVGFVLAERILYIPSMGFCFLAAEAVHQLWARRPRSQKTVVIAITTSLLLLFSVRTWMRNFDWQSEEALYRSGIDVNPPKAWGNLANILKSQGKIGEAEEAYKNALSYRGNMADVHYNLGILLQESKRYEEALTSYQLAIQCRPRLSMAHLNLGIVLNTLGRHDEAEAVYRHAATLDDTGLKDPKNQMTGVISSLFNLGRLLQDQGRYEEALKVFKEAIERRPNHYTPQSLYNMLGETYFKLGRNEDAEKWFKKSLEAKPDHIPAHLTYAHMLGKTSRFAEAQKFFKRAKDLEPSNHNVYQHYGQFLNDLGQYNEALAMFSKAYDLRPDDHEATFNLANALRQARNNERAEEFYKRAALLKPEAASSHMNLGAMYHLNGKLGEAEQSYMEALRLKPNDQTTLQNLMKLRSLMAKVANGDSKSTPKATDG
ncbi:transmembrane and TPR repeat-containing protein 2-like isoform X2 [Acanthaster planci]|uniref:dolichyl-phosphate-mannose--protein mannosyltransferase n=1 Tax=Acanthaster planci TaxID=133434 RepID=A0A8B7YYB9_ACAPL|nr:transmembrane and TPR repeat-containing protein 2-like isoform X2 [Acanthaster planci]